MNGTTKSNPQRFAPELTGRDDGQRSLAASRLSLNPFLLWSLTLAIVMVTCLFLLSKELSQMAL